MGNGMKITAVALTMAVLGSAPEFSKVKDNAFYSRRLNGDSAKYEAPAPKAVANQKGGTAILVVDLSISEKKPGSGSAIDSVCALIRENPGIPVIQVAYDRREIAINNAKKLAEENKGQMTLQQALEGVGVAMNGKALSLDTSSPVMREYVEPFDERIMVASGYSAIRIYKKEHSAFDGTRLEDTLRYLKINTLVIAGFHWLDCVRKTVEDAIAKKYTVVATPGIFAGNADSDSSRQNGLEFYQSKAIFLNSVRDVNGYLKK